MGDFIRKSHNVSLLMYHIVCVATYRRLIITDECRVLDAFVPDYTGKFEKKDAQMIEMDDQKT
jgi:putative transposase